MRQLDDAPCLPDGARMLHIGLPKTGTTAIQAALHVARQALVEQGVRYAAPRNTRHPYAAARYAIGEPMPHRAGADRLAWRAVVRRFRTSDARATAFSSEALYLASEQRARSIVDEIGGQAHVVVTLRPFAYQLRSRWQQTVVGGGQATFDDWARRFLDNSTRVRRNGPEGILDSWSPAVGAERIVFMVADPGDRDVLFRRFEALLGLSDHTLEPAHVDNAALSSQGSEFLRQLNILDPVKRADPTTDRAHVLRTGTRRIQHMPGLSRERPQVAKWAAIRANEVAAGWIDRLESSAATVIGRPQDLVVDVDGLPDAISAPAVIDVAEAARFAHTYWNAAMENFEKARAVPEQERGELSTQELLALLRSRLARRLTR